MKSRSMYFFRILTAFFFALLFSVSSFAASVDNTTNNQDTPAIIQYQLLCTQMKHIQMQSKSTLEYPAQYGGAFIRDDGKLVVLWTDITPSTISTVRSYTRSSDTVLQKAFVSYNQLVLHQKQIIHRYQNLRSNCLISESVNSQLSTLLNSFVGIGIEERNNRICVLLTDTSSENLEAFRIHLSDYDRITFEKSGHVVAQSSTLQPGDYIRTGLGSGSIGYRCSYQGTSSTQYGFVTAAHLAGSVGQSVYVTPEGTTPIICGTVRRLQYSGAVDAAFVETSNGYSISNQTPAGKLIVSSWFTHVPEGTSVILHGRTSGEKSGVVRNNSFSFTTEDGIDMAETLRCSYSSDAGDSGGIVFSQINGDYAVVGIHHGAVSFLQGVNGRAIAIKAQHIYTMLRVIPY